MKELAYSVAKFFFNNWKTSIRILVGVYFASLGLTILAGGNIANIGITLPGITNFIS